MVTPDDIAVELGRPTPVELTRSQWQKWIDRAIRTIQNRATELAVDFAGLDPDTVDDVVTYAVIRRISRPVDGAQSSTDQLSVDDGSWQQTRRYESGMGDIYFTDHWWSLLGLGGTGGVFSVRMEGEPDTTYLPEVWT